jgi:hypothetical protein
LHIFRLPQADLFLEFTIFSTNIFAALPLKKAAEPLLLNTMEKGQQNICSQAVI